MHAFHYRDGTLCCEGVRLRDLAAEYGTPLYVYSGGTVRDHYRRLDAALAPLNRKICYAVKANSNLAVLALLAQEGAGFDIVSGGELFRVLRAGGKAESCSFAGVGKTREEIEYALREGIHSFNVESAAELAFLNRVAGELGCRAPAAARVNPNVDARTHAYISTGKKENKFGIDFEAIPEIYTEAARLPHLWMRGLQMHIGSQLTAIEPFVEALRKVAPLAAQLRDAHGIEFFSIGGGIGIIYEDSLRSGDPAWWTAREDGESPLSVRVYAEAVAPLLEPLGLRILLEPGRVIVGNAGVLLTRVLYEKRGGAKTFTIVDAGMNDLIRPALYQGHHEIVPVEENPGAERETVDVVGPVCESGDFLARDREMPATREGDLLAVLSAGAYGFVMSSNYNSRPLPAEVLVEGERAELVRARQRREELTAGERIPEALGRG
ncbi:MAG TPA: diaminopimelate decarboxylase [Verrucomicrobiales bacterium]|nr:diaminopimelate decarboxylase [Verrucomicrobiales bacterium]